MKKGDFSKLIEQAVRTHIFHRTVQDIKAFNADNTVREVRAERCAKGKADKA